MRRFLALIVSSLAGCAPAARHAAGDDGAVGSDGSSCQRSCSADLHDIIDCMGHVVETCPAGEGCGPAGTCLTACQAAAANKSSIGCEYYVTSPAVIPDTAGGCFAAFIANTSGYPISITVERDGTTFPLAGFARVPSGAGQAITYAPLANGMLDANQVAILFLARFGSMLTNCPAGVTPAFTTADAAVHGTGYGKAFHITTSAPVVAYDIFPYGGGSAAATSATLLLPTSVWDLNYVGVDAYRMSRVATGAQPTMALVGAEDNTTVMIRPTAAITAGSGVAPAAAGVVTSYPLSSCLSIDVFDSACDSAHQQIPPVKALGYRYAAVRYRNRFAGLEEIVPWRMVGAVDGTTLAYSPTAPPGAPTTLVAGQVAEFQSPGQFVVTSQDKDHPFYVSAHMTGCGRLNPTLEDCRGDPEFVNVVPPDQYLESYTFFTDPTYPETNLVLVREQKNGVFGEVNLDCLGTVTGWQPLDSSGSLQYTRVDLVTGNFSPVGGCNNGLHVASSTQPFGLVIWGWGSAVTEPFHSTSVSYAYPAGASVKPINTVVVIP